MRISQKGLYALQALIVLTRRQKEGAIRIRDIAYEENLPHKFLEVILLELKNARLVESVRGANGGYRLRRPPAQVFLSEVIRTIDGPLAPFGGAALEGLTNTGYEHRALYRAFMQVRNATADILDHTSLADRLERHRHSCKKRSGSTPQQEQLTKDEYMQRGIFQLITSLLIMLIGLIPMSAGAQTVVRVGCFGNITHSQALVGKAKKWFEKALGPDVRIEWTMFNAGPSAIEALFAGAVDMTYVGPNPALTGYIRSHGEALRVIAGATSGGAALVVRADSGIQKAEDFHGKRVASPQLANTQDIALRAWLRSKGLKLREKGGDVQVLPIANADQLNLFQKKQLDAAWAPEPWASRLIREANGRLFLDERDLWPKRQFVTAQLVVSTKFLRAHPDLVEKWVRAHVELTDWINSNLEEAKRLLNQQIQKDTGAKISAAVLDDSFSRLQVTYDPVRASMLTSAKWEFEEGFLGRQMPDLSGMYDLSLLNKVLREKHRKEVE